MKRISFNKRFINAAGNDLMPGKIHTIRQNFEYWKKFEGKEIALFTWKGKPYQKGSKQKVFCIKRIVSVQSIKYLAHAGMQKWFEIDGVDITAQLGMNDGFWHEPNRLLIMHWFLNYEPGKMAVLHFTDFRY